jgi:hypothetical protein
MSIFTAPRRPDGTFSPKDLALQILTAYALELPTSKEVSGVYVAYQTEGPGAETVHAIWQAIHGKHFAGKDSHKKPKEARQVARDLVLDVLANSADVSPYASIIAAFAEQNDRDFLERLGRGFTKERMPLFKPDEWFLLLNWNEWQTGTPADLAALPPLKHWTDNAAMTLLAMRGAEQDGSDLSTSAYQKKRARLQLEQSKPAKVLNVFPGRGDTVKVETAD